MSCGQMVSPDHLTCNLLIVVTYVRLYDNQKLVAFPGKLQRSGVLNCYERSKHVWWLVEQK